MFFLWNNSLNWTQKSIVHLNIENKTSFTLESDYDYEFYTIYMFRSVIELQTSFLIVFFQLSRSELIIVDVILTIKYSRFIEITRIILNHLKTIRILLWQTVLSNQISCVVWRKLMYLFIAKIRKTFLCVN